MGNYRDNIGFFSSVPLSKVTSAATFNSVAQSFQLLDIEKFNNQILSQSFQITNVPTFKSSIITLASDRRTDIRNQTISPDFISVELIKDGLNNINILLSFQIKRLNVESGNIVGFNIYRRKFSDEEIKNDPDSNISNVQILNPRSFDRICHKITRRGGFSEEKKAVSYISRDYIDQSILNPNLSDDLSKNNIIKSTSQIELNLSNKFEKISYVDYSTFIIQQQRKFVFVQQSDVVDVSYVDKKVAINEVYEYYVTCVVKDSQESQPSNSIKVLVHDPSPISAPISVTVKQVDSSIININVIIDPQDNISSIFLYKRSEDETQFLRVAQADNIKDSIQFVDSDIIYSKNYNYRIFLQNIFGELSDPSEVTVFSSVSKITPQSRSNNLKIPVFVATSDQNSSFIKIIISPNDPTVSYYELQRKDLTIKERNFRSPSNIETNFGGNGWSSNKFFVNRRTVDSTSSDQVVTKVVLDEIIFIDDTVEPDHIYQYRVIGYDLFKNSTSYQFSIAKSESVKSLRSPINLKSEILRGHPFRTKISWDDDNINQNLDTKIFYRIQRRKKDSIVYETFPLTENNFFIDEVMTDDFIPFSVNKISDIFSSQENKEKSQVEIQRPLLLPEFLQDNNVYYYRVSIVKENQEESNFTAEIEVSTIIDLSDPIDFKVQLVNPKVKPFSAKLTWDIDPLKALPDHWVIEKKKNQPNDYFKILSKVYIIPEFVDRSLEKKSEYIYRIRSVDVFGKESNTVETRLIV